MITPRWGSSMRLLMPGGGRCHHLQCGAVHYQAGYIITNSALRVNISGYACNMTRIPSLKGLNRRRKLSRGTSMLAFERQKPLTLSPETKGTKRPIPLPPFSLFPSHSSLFFLRTRKRFSLFFTQEDRTLFCHMKKKE